MISLIQNSNNKITFQKETDTPLVSSSLTDGFVYNIALYPTLNNDTSLSQITYVTSSNESNPRWTTLNLSITSSTDYYLGEVSLLNGTTYNMEIYYGPILSGSTVWSQTSTLWGETAQLWNAETSYSNLSSQTLKYSDRVFISGSTTPRKTTYISPNEDATYNVYQG